MDWDSFTSEALTKIFGRKYLMELAGYEMSRSIDSCPFIEQGSTAIRWDGRLSPCLPLLHTNQNYFGHRFRSSQSYSIGSVMERDIIDLWNDPEYVALRDRLQYFDFSPCTICTGCELSEENQEDCLGNTELACGGCLWAQGVIRCP
jgi:MoaA/NifB/PqqE/SkfB family radical SAM enzyme